jgi:SAM-dependent methyltransferase
LPTITAQMVDDYLATFEFFRQPGKPEYLLTARDRLVTTLNLIPRLPDPEGVRVLEIGGMPYFMTVLVEKFFGYKVEVANEPTWERGEGRNVEVLESDLGDRHEIHYKTLNIENDPWPWPDGSFDIVLYCEVIEHLGYDPTHTLVEAHRVLKPRSGQLLLSTPNALCYSYLVKMVKGRNYYPPYSGHGFYARHHRLFSPEELTYLCTKIGYQMHTCYSAYDRAYDHPRWLEPAVRALMRVGKLKRRLDVIYLLASPVGTAKPVYPDQWPHLLYGDVAAYRSRLGLSRVRMGDDVTAPLMDGFHDLEPWGDGVRWTGPRARLRLYPKGHRDVEISFYSGPAERGAKVAGWVAMAGEDGAELERHAFSVPSDSWETLTFPLPDQLPAELVIEVGVDEPMVPNQIDPANGDGRALGVAVREVALRRPEIG